MINLQNENTSAHEATYDDLMASLFVLITHYSLSQCESTLKVIVDRLDTLCDHSEIEFYPNQFTVITKMKRVWQTKLFDAAISQSLH